LFSWYQEDYAVTCFFSELKTFTLFSKSSFSDELLDWLSFMHFDYTIKHDSRTIFDLVEIRKQDKVLLCLKLIDIKLWLENEKAAQSELLEFKTKQSEIRATDIAVVTLWEDVWYTKKEIVKSRISAILGISQRIPGRVTQVRKIDRPTAADFLDNNHLQGSVASKIRYGLFLPKRYFRVLNTDFQIDTNLDELLVAVATFSHPRTFERDGNAFRSYELSRFANLKNTTVVGGFDKLIRAFTEDYKPGDIMTYADLEWSDGASYKRLGFKEITDKEPIPFLLDPSTNTRYPENRYPEHDKLIRIYNAGSRKFVKDII
jgi:hypothetical protein